MRAHRLQGSSRLSNYGPAQGRVLRSYGYCTSCAQTQPITAGRTHLHCARCGQRLLRIAQRPA